jgi:aspartate carbamoyltransferase catalytic subunit
MHLGYSQKIALDTIFKKRRIRKNVFEFQYSSIHVLFQPTGACKEDSMDARFEGWPHVICSQQFSRAWLENHLFPESRKMKEIVMCGGCDILKGKRAVSLFYQPSTRTACSFASAIDFLGGKIVFSTDNAREFSSANKGEILADAILTHNRYKPDVIILRYDREIGAEIAADVSSVPIINAGDRQPVGEPISPFSGQHPTQAFLDIFTIQERFGQIDGIKIAMVGDLKNGRTVRSLSYLLGKFKGVQIYFVSPKEQEMRNDVKSYLKRHNVYFAECRDLREVVHSVDVAYQTRTQVECGSVPCIEAGCKIGAVIASLMKPTAIIMHPFPRVDELALEVDQNPRAVYLTDQIDSGLYTRMGLLKIILTQPKKGWISRPWFFPKRRNSPLNGRFDLSRVEI